MGKPTGKKKDQDGQKPGNANGKQSKASKAFDEDTALFINMSQELKDEGNRLFQKYDHEGAMLKYEKALKLLPKNHIDVAHLHTNMAACYMQMGLGEYPRAIHECNLALEVSPRYSKAFLRRAKCYEALNRLDLAIRDVNTVLYVEPNNLSALETKDGIKKVMEEKGIVLDEEEIGVVEIELPGAARLRKVVKEKFKKKDKKVEEKAKNQKVEEKAKNQKVEEKAKNQKVEEKAKNQKVEERATDKLVVEDRDNSFKDKEIFTKNVVEEEKVVLKLVEENIVSKTVKLVFGEDIRWAQLPLNCSMRLVRDVARDRFSGLKGVLVKYRDQEGDLVTITTTNELRLAESLCDSQGSLRLYITDVSPDQEPLYDGICNEEHKDDKRPSNVTKNGDAGKGREVKSESICIEDWILQFARLFKNHVGFDSDSYLDLHELGMKIYSEAMEDAVTSVDAEELFDIAAGMFQEMAALALFNWGNVHLSKARKRVSLGEDASRDFIVEQIKAAYEWANKEYTKAEMRYGEALRIKPDFYEGYLALGQQQFEQAKLCWYYAIGSNVDIETDSWSEKVLQHYNKAEDSMEKGMLMWEEMEEQRLNGLSKSEKYKSQLQKMGLDGLFKDITIEEAAEQAANMKSQIYLLWGTLLYERSIVEYRLGMPTWEECVEVSVEKFELAGASQTDIAVMIKNHCSNETALEGFGFKIDEIVQAWNEMYDAKRWQFGVPSFRLEPLFRRRVPKLHSILEYY